MPKKFYIDIPSDYAVCQHCDCAVAGSCLRQTAYPELLAKASVLQVVNPNMCSKDAQCKYYRSNEPVTYAKGFTNFQKQMFAEQYGRFSKILIGKFGRNPYYERRRGETALSPKEQQIVIDALKKAGVTEELKFDSYVDNFNWYD